MGVGVYSCVFNQSNCVTYERYFLSATRGKWVTEKFLDYTDLIESEFISKSASRIYVTHTHILSQYKSKTSAIDVKFKFISIRIYFSDVFICISSRIPFSEKEKKK